MYKDRGLPWWLGGKETAWNAGDPGSFPGLEKSPGEGNGNRSSILTWEILQTEEPGGLVVRQTWGPQTVRHDLVTTQHQ